MNPRCEFIIITIIATRQTILLAHQVGQHTVTCQFYDLLGPTLLYSENSENSEVMRHFYAIQVSTSCNDDHRPCHIKNLYKCTIVTVQLYIPLMYRLSNN